MDDNKWMQEAINEAVAAKAEANLPFAAVIVKGDKMLGKAHSLEHTLSDVTAHAELQAISQASRTNGLNLSDCTIYSTVEPCTMCSAAILQAQISHIAFGATRDDLPRVMRNRKIRLQQLIEDSPSKPEVRTGILKEEILELFMDVHLR
jgi:tRNA(adenine34) deaminase